MRGSQLFAPSVLGLGEAETPITADKRLHYATPKLPSATSFIRKTLSEVARSEWAKGQFRRAMRRKEQIR